MTMQLLETIRNYRPYNEQEEKDREEMIRRLENKEELLTRDNRSAHFTASAWIVNKEKTKVLMAYHNIYDSWAWLGGHADGEEDLLKVALKEVKEESGLDAIPLSSDIFSLEILTVDGHMKNGEYVSSHLHLNVTYLLEGDEYAAIRNKDDENKAVAWFDLDEALLKSSEPWFVEHIYRKLNDKLRKMKDN